jgi:phage nucleotide-binding protein
MINFLIYGESGAGKTVLGSTLPQPILFLDAERGMLSVKGKNLDAVTINSVQAVGEAYSKLLTDNHYKSIVIDSLSELADLVLLDQKSRTKDGRLAYQMAGEIIAKIMRDFRALNKHVCFLARLDKTQDETGKIMFGPSVLGQSLSKSVPYHVDEVFALRVGRLENGKKYRYLLTDGDDQWLAKDRSGKLDEIAEPNLDNLIKLIEG